MGSGGGGLAAIVFLELFLTSTSLNHVGMSTSLSFRSVIVVSGCVDKMDLPSKKCDRARASESLANVR